MWVGTLWDDLEMLKYAEIYEVGTKKASHRSSAQPGRAGNSSTTGRFAAAFASGQAPDSGADATPG